MPGNRRVPIDDLFGLTGGTVTFEVTVTVGNRPTDPKNNDVEVEIFSPAFLKGGFQSIDGPFVMTRLDIGIYEFTYNIPLSLTPSDEYMAFYKANFDTIVSGSPDNFVTFSTEFFSIRETGSPVGAFHSTYATVADVRSAFFNIDSFLPDNIAKDTDKRDKILQDHLIVATDKLRESLNLTQIRAHSADRREYTLARAIYTILIASKGQRGSAISSELLKEWDRRAERILAQLKREGDPQSMPLGLG